MDLWAKTVSWTILLFQIEEFEVIYSSSDWIRFFHFQYWSCSEMLQTFCVDYSTSVRSNTPNHPWLGYTNFSNLDLELERNSQFTLIKGSEDTKLVHERTRTVYNTRLQISYISLSTVLQWHMQLNVMLNLQFFFKY